jgi:hypothetical protein
MFDVIWGPVVMLPMPGDARNDEEMREKCAILISKMKRDGDLPDELDFVKILSLEPFGETFAVQGVPWMVVQLYEREKR